MINRSVDIEELPAHTCWSFLHATAVGRLAVWVDDHPDIFPLNFVTDHGTIVFRSDAGTKVAGALTEAPVALEIDGYDAETGKAWSVVVKGRAESIKVGHELMATLELPLFPWQAGTKGHFLRVTPDSVTGRRFTMTDPETWKSPLTASLRTPTGPMNTVTPREETR